MTNNPTVIGGGSGSGQPVRRIGPYELQQLLGRGGMAEVYRAYQPALDRYVAIKLLSSNLASDSDFIERFRREARSIAKLRHPNIIAVYDFGEEANIHYLVMELMEGKTLQDEIKRGPMPLRRITDVMEQIGGALDTAHRANIVHRDIKPSNILLDGPRRAVLTDFGIAKELGRNTLLTQAGYSVGTPDYMSPEQALGRPLDARSDQYSLAIVLYEMLTGRVPFQSDSAVVVLAAHVNNPPPSPRQFNPSIPPAIEGVVMRALSKEPQQRFNGVSDMVRALQQAAGGGAPNMGATSIGNAPQPMPQAQRPPSIPATPTAATMRNQPPVYAPPQPSQQGPAYAPTAMRQQSMSGIGSASAAMPQSMTGNNFFGYRGLPGVAPVPKGVVGPPPTPLRNRGGGLWLFLLLLLLLLIVLVVIGYLLVTTLKLV